MATKQDFLNFINNKTCNKFSFIRLKQVFFDATKNCCLIQFIYPSEKELTDEDKRYLYLKWGKGYSPDEWVRLEQLFNEMM